LVIKHTHRGDNLSRYTYLFGNVNGIYRELSEPLPKSLVTSHRIDNLFENYGRIEFNDVVPEKRSLIILLDESEPLYCLIRTSAHKKASASSYFTHAEFFSLHPELFRTAINGIVDFSFISEDGLVAANLRSSENCFINQLIYQDNSKRIIMLNTIDKSILFSILSELMYFWTGYGKTVTVVLPDADFCSLAISFVQTIEQMMPYAMRAHIGFSIGQYIQKEHRSIGLKIVPALNTKSISSSAETVINLASQYMQLPTSTDQLSPALNEFIRKIVSLEKAERIEYFEYIYQVLEGNGDIRVFWSVTGRDYEVFFQMTECWPKLNAEDRFREIEDYIRNPLPLLDCFFQSKYCDFMDANTFSTVYFRQIDSVTSLDELLSLAIQTKDIVELNPCLVELFNEGLLRWLSNQHADPSINTGNLLSCYVECSKQLSTLFIYEKQIRNRVFSEQDFINSVEQEMISVFTFSELELMLKRYSQLANQDSRHKIQFEHIPRLFYKSFKSNNQRVYRSLLFMENLSAILGQYYSEQSIQGFMANISEDIKSAVLAEYDSVSKQLEQLGEYNGKELISEFTEKVLNIACAINYAENWNAILNISCAALQSAFRFFFESDISDSSAKHLLQAAKKIQDNLPEEFEACFLPILNENLLPSMSSYADSVELLELGDSSIWDRSSINENSFGS